LTTGLVKSEIDLLENQTQLEGDIRVRISWKYKTEVRILGFGSDCTYSV